MRHDLKPVPVPVAEVTVVGGVIRREYRVPAGMVLFSHMHAYDHLSVLLSGRARLSRDGIETVLQGPWFVEIKAGVQHELHAITDCVWDCLHGLEQSQDDPLIMSGVA